MSYQQVYSSAEAQYGNYQVLFWVGGVLDGQSSVPDGYMLEITSLTLNYFPEGEGVLGRADVAGRDANGTSIWRVQTVYVWPQQTVHLTFPKSLRLEAGGHAEVGFTSDGPGVITVDANGALVST